MKFNELMFLTRDKDALMAYLISHNVIPHSVKCTSCNNDAPLIPDADCYRCRKYRREKDNKKRNGKVKCDFFKSVKSVSWFGFSRIEIAQQCMAIAYFLFINYPRQTFMVEELNMSNKSVVRFQALCRDVCVAWAKKTSAPIGGEGKIVEIDESKFGHQKYHKGRLSKGQWVFGGFERESKKIFLVAVQDRTSETLLTIIKEWIKPGSTIISDCWKSYDCLNNNDFHVLTVNHKYNFVDPDTGAHTQNIERTWRDVKDSVPKYGRREYNYTAYFAEFLFKRHYDYGERVNNFFDVISGMKLNNMADIEEEEDKEDEEEDFVFN